ncbi:DUF3253 domain-containing protein [Plastoroseomonas hellenica]|uniref:DUF3253 domain-containing protein n=1 Tax=Plastoroseomonas hellenica TaxID=2687306 RepID=UPI001BAC660F|nr:DUF3253 domain-containing protein [Plastoroseomonas hellenica]MBR0643867.1 DUF3253 domain-containing protein [Plastoroseomonas hellenica]
MNSRPDDSAIEAEILARVTAAGPGSSISPSDVAQALAPLDWRPLLGPVRRLALKLQAEDRIAILRKGKAVPAAEVRGVIRLALPGGRA